VEDGRDALPFTDLDDYADGEVEQYGNQAEED
jgi:hypothetical protein